MVSDLVGNRILSVTHASEKEKKARSVETDRTPATPKCELNAASNEKKRVQSA